MPDLIRKLKSPHHLRQQIGGAIFLFLILFSKHGGAEPDRRWLIPIGAFLYVLGFAGRIWSSGFLVKNESLTTTGPYGYVRNPIYVCNLLLGFGLALLSGIYWGVFLLAILYILCYAPGMRIEEENLRRRYPADFDPYASAVPLIFPRFRAVPGYGGDVWRYPAYAKNKEMWVTLGLLIGFGFVLWRRLCAS